METLLVALAAGVGAVTRYAVDQALTGRTRGRFPTGTFVVNVTGSALLGLVTGLALHHGLGSASAAIVGVGLAGGYTTFSTWVWECLALAETGAQRTAAAYGVGSLLAGLAAAAAGLGLALL